MKKKTDKELKILKENFWDKVLRSGRCILAGRDCLRCEGTGETHQNVKLIEVMCHHCSGTGRHACGGVMDAHHVIPKMTVRNASPPETREEAMWDPRNGVPLCRSGHEPVTIGTFQIPKDYFPSQLWAFAADYSLDWWLEKEYSEGDWGDTDGRGRE